MGQHAIYHCLYFCYNYTLIPHLGQNYGNYKSFVVTSWLVCEFLPLAMSEESFMGDLRTKSVSVTFEAKKSHSVMVSISHLSCLLCRIQQPTHRYHLVTRKYSILQYYNDLSAFTLRELAETVKVTFTLVCT